MCKETCVKVMLLAFNIIFLFLGLGVLAVGLYVRFIRTEFDEIIGSSLIPVATYICVAAGSVVVFVSLIGCAGTLLQNRPLLIAYTGFLVLVFMLEVTAGILGFIHQNKVVEILDEHLKPAILERYGYKENQLITTAVDTIQQELQCCGYNSPTDWALASYYQDTYHMVVERRADTIMPISCCSDKTVTGCNIIHDDLTRFSKGCMYKVKDILTNNLMILGAASIAIAAVQLLGVVLAISLCYKSRDDVEEF